MNTQPSSCNIPPPEDASLRSVNTGLGVLSLGLGLAEVIMPNRVARMVGIEPHPALIRALGFREMVSGIGLLGQKSSPSWTWVRLGGDLMDLALLGFALGSRPAQPHRVGAAAFAVASIGVMDLAAAGIQQSARRHEGKHFRSSITVNRPPMEVFEAWRDFQNLPYFMPHLEYVRQTAPNRWHWAAQGPAGFRVEWDAEIINERKNELIAWQSLEDSQVNHAGSVRFEPAPDGLATQVKVEMVYRAPLGAIGQTAAKLTGSAPEQQVPVDLQRFKQWLEAGEVPTTEGQPSGRAKDQAEAQQDESLAV